MTLEELRRLHPRWTIEAEEGRYSAVMPRWGALYGQNLKELAARMAKWAAENDEFQNAYPSVEDGTR